MGRCAGLMAFTADCLPVADRAPGLPGVWVTGRPVEQPGPKVLVPSLNTIVNRGAPPPQCEPRGSDRSVPGFRMS